MVASFAYVEGIDLKVLRAMLGLEENHAVLNANGDIFIDGVSQDTLDAAVSSYDMAPSIAAAERAWRDGELLKADIEVNKAADTSNPTEQSWRQYREALRHWPASEYFPSQASRPVSPTPGDAV